MVKKTYDFDYNTQRTHLVIREYGRHVQSMVEYAVSVKDRENRNKLAQAIIELMGQMNPGLRNVDEFRHKLWDHIYIISGGKLDVDYPYPKPNLEVIQRKPKHIGYPKQDIRFKHYGKNVERLIEKAISMEDEDKKRGFTECIGNYMKLVHRNWNKENANDETIKADIEILSGGKLHLEEGSNLDSLTRSSKPRKRAESRNNGGGYGRRDRDDRSRRDRNGGRDRQGQGGHRGFNRNRRNRDNRDRQ
ncbi:MAG TPA: DUF4290 domain-containing protein [Chitinophagales bacterium]|nr:DUF4290 domain-containing protein [Chitinophagales bacterium]